MGKSVAGYDGSIYHYDLFGTFVGLYHYQYSRHTIVKLINIAYHDSDDRRDGYRYSDGLTCWLNGCMVCQCNND